VRYQTCREVGVVCHVCGAVVECGTRSVVMSVHNQFRRAHPACAVEYVDRERAKRVKTAGAKR
jgi:primosomal protein N'